MSTNPTQGDGFAPLNDEAKQSGVGAPSANAKPAESIPGIDTEGSARRSRISSGTVFLIGAVVIAGGLLGAMRYVGLGPRGASAKITFDDELMNAAGKPARDHRLVLGDLNASRLEQQVPDSAVKRNPFKLALGNETAIDPAADAARKSAEELRRLNEQRAKDAANRAKSVDEAFKKLALHGVMGGSVPLARINAQTVKLGDKIGPFVVTKISGRTVEMEADARVFRLELAQGGEAGDRESEPLLEQGFPWNTPTPPSQTGEPSPK